MELVGRFPTGDEVLKYQLVDKIPAWLPSNGDDQLSDILTEKVVLQLRSIRKFNQMSNYMSGDFMN